MDNDITQLKPEQELALQFIYFRKPDVRRIQKLISENVLDWAEILGYLVYNRVAGISYGVLREALGYEKLVVNREFRISLNMIYDIQKIRTKIYSRIVFELAEKLKEAKIPHAFLKGSVLANSMFPLGYRTSNDIDILVHDKDLTRCGTILKELEYIQGFYDRSKDIINPASRKDILHYRMNYGEVVPYLKKLKEDGLDLVEIDINFSLNWVAQGTGDIVKEFLNGIEEYKFKNGNKVISLSCEYFLVHLCVHLYKEAIVFNWVKGQRDLCLYKFVDIYAFLTDEKNSIDWDKLVTIAKKYGLVKECYYTFEYTRIIFPVFNKHEKFLDCLYKIKPDNIEYLNEIYDAADQSIKYKWKKDLIYRIFDMKRYESLERIFKE